MGTERKIKSLIQKRPGIFVTDPAYQMASCRHAPEMSEIIWEVKRAMARGIDPEVCDHGATETYLLKGEDGTPLAIFKLENYLPELAAYRLDHKRFAKVPPTALTTLSHPIWKGEKTGSCQFYLSEGVSASNYMWDECQKLEAPPIRKIAALDIRILNEDRHTSNILILNKKEAIPIDHGFCLKEELGFLHLHWVFWEQSETSWDERELSYLLWLDPEGDRRLLLDELHFPEGSANRVYIATQFLKEGALRGASPIQIGRCFIANTPNGEEQTPFQLLIERLYQKEAPSWPHLTCHIHDEIQQFWDGRQKEDFAF
ncbi:MAG: hypothetical protein K940chlam9_00406 [Chlamydiae bacterium]|nr:hypothetical protein [Chlamydiota bacterium]